MALVVVEETLAGCIIRNLFVISAKLFDIDPKLIYRENLSWTRNQRKPIYGAKILARRGRHSILLNTYGRLLEAFLYYFMLKCSIVCSIQLFRHRVDHITVYQQVGANYSSYLDQLSRLIGNPLSQLAGVSVFLYSGISWALFTGNFWIARAHKRKPIEFNRLNLVVDCEHEVKRIDLVISNKLDSTIRQLDYTVMFNFVTKCQCHKFYSDMSNYYTVIAERQQHLQQLKAILNQLKSRAYLIRPAIYQPENYPRHARNLLISVTVYLVVLIIPNVPMILPFLVKGAVESTCYKHMIVHGLDVKYYKRDCTFRNVFSWQDILFCFELLLALILLCWMFLCETILIIDGVYTQFISIQDLEDDFIRCIAELNYPIIDDAKSGTRITRSTDHPDSLNYQLLKTFLKYNILDEDGTSNSDLISRFLNSLLSYVGFGLILGLVGGKIEDIERGFDLQFIRSYSLLWLLFQANLVILSCAHLQAKEAKLSKLIFSITSRLLRGGNFESRNTIDSYLISNWIRLAHGRSYHDTISPIRFLNLMKIDYRKLLELNFVFISVAALLKSL